MAGRNALVDSLVEFLSVAEIRAEWRKVFVALASRSTEPIQVVQQNFEGGSTGGIVLSTRQEMEEFIQACQAAIRIKEGDTDTPASQLGSSADFSSRILAV